jgi:hypothetical protein
VRSVSSPTRIPLATPPAGLRSGNANLDDLVDYADAQEIEGERQAQAAAQSGRRRMGRVA